MKTSIKLFIFEPYEWSYCGGAIGIVAKDIKQAVDIIIEEDIKDAERKFKEEKVFDRTSDTTVDDCRTYRRKYFGRTTKNFKKDGWDQWLLSHELTIIEDGRPNPRILFNDWNYA